MNKVNLSFLFSLFFSFFICSFSSFAQITYFYKSGSPDPATASSWNTALDGTGTNATSFASPNIFVLTSNRNIVRTAALNMSTAVLEIRSGSTLTVNSGGSLTVGTFRIQGGGTYIHNNGTAVLPGTTKQFHSGNNLSVGNGTIEIQNQSTGQFATGTAWGNVIINYFSAPSSAGNAAAFADVRGDFTLEAFGSSKYTFTSTQTTTHNILGNLIVNGGTLVFKNGSGAIDVNISGNVFVNGGTLTMSEGGTVNCLVSGNFNLAGGTFRNTSSANTAPLEVLGNFNYTSGTFSNPNVASNLIVRGNVSCSAALSSSLTNLILKGTNNQTLSGSISVGNFDVNNAIAKTGTTTLLSGTSLTVTSAIAINCSNAANQFSDGGNQITVSGQVAMGGNAAGYSLTGTLRITPVSVVSLIGFSGGSPSNTVPLVATINNLTVGASSTGGINFMPSIGTNTYTIAGNLTIESTGSGNIAFNSHLVKCAGNFIYSRTSNTLNFGANHIFEFNGNSSQNFNSSVSAGLIMNSVLVSNTSNTVTFNNPLLITSGGSFVANALTIVDLTSSQISVNGASAATVTLNGQFFTANSNGFSGTTSTAINSTNTTLTIGLNSTIIYNRAGTQTITTAIPYQFLIIRGSGDKTATTDITVNKDFTILETAAAKAQGVTLNIGGNWNVASTADYFPGSNALSTVIFTSSGAQSLNTVGGETFRKLKVVGGGTLNLLSDVNISVDSLVVLNASTLNQSTFTLNGSGSVYMSSNSKLTISKLGVTVPELSGSYTFDANSTVELNGNGDQSLKAGLSYKNLTFSGVSGLKNISTTPNVDGTVLVNNNNTVNIGNSTFGGATTNLTMTAGRYITSGTGTKPGPDGVYNLTGGVIQFDNNGATQQSIRSKTYMNVEVTGSNVGNSTGLLTLASNGTFKVKAGGVFTINSDNITGPIGTQTVTIDSGGTFRCGDPDGFALNGNLTSLHGNIENIVLSTGSTIEYSRSGDQEVTNIGYSNFTISGSGNKNVAFNLTIPRVTTFTNGTLVINGNTLTLNGVVNATNGTILGTTSSAVTVGGSGACNLPACNVFNLNQNRSSSLTLNGDLTFWQTLNLNNGSIDLNNKLLNVNGNLFLFERELTNNGTLNVSSTGILNSSHINGLSGLGTNIPTANIIFGVGSKAIFDRSGAQTMSARNDYYNVEVKNGGILSLDGNVEIVNDLVFNTKKIQINNNLLVVKGSVSGYNSSSYVITNGTGRFKLHNIGATPKILSIGTSTTYNPIEITNSGTVDNFSVKVKTGIDFSVDSNGVAKGDPNSIVDRQWIIEEDVVGGSNVALKFYWNESSEKVNFNRNSSLHVGHYHIVPGVNNGNAIWQRIPAVLGGSTPEFYADISGVTTFSPFAVGSNIGLPVELTEFNCKLIDDKVFINWVTASEKNNSHFDVEKSTDGKTFKILATVEGKGNSQNLNVYNQIDKTPSEINYYRLKQVDFDGTYTYSEVKRVVSTKIQNQIFNVYPNPVKNELNIVGFVDGELVVYDINGKIVKQISKSKLNQTIDFSGFENGLYFLQYNSNTIQKFVKIIKQ